MTIRNLDFLFRPRSIAVIGASDDAASVGSAVMRNLLAGGFRGPVFPVHLQRQSIAGVYAYRFAADLPQAPDLALVCAPPATVPQIIHELGVRGTRAAAVLASDSPGPDVLAAAKPHLMRILGPDSTGLLVPGLGLNASFAPTPAQPGRIAFVSQSGALAAAALDWAAARGVGFSHVVSLGDALDVDAADVLDYLGSDPEVGAVLLYLREVKAGRKFISAARAAARAKPVIVLKSGRSAAARAALRQAGADAGNDEVFDAAIARAGALRVGTMTELFAAAETLGRDRPSVGERLIILTNAGGPAVLAADALAARGGEQAAELIDLGGDASAARYGDALVSLLGKRAGDAVLLIHGPSAVVDAEAVAAACARAAQGHEHAVLACWMGGERVRQAAAPLRHAGIPIYDAPEDAAQAFLHALSFRRNQEALQEAPSSIPVDFAPDEAGVRRIVDKALAERRGHLTEPEAKALLAAYSIPVVDTYVAATAEDAVRLAQQIGYPVALKVLSPDLEHRADVGGVMLNLEGEDEVRRAAGDIARRMRELRPTALLAGFTVQPMVRRPGAVHPRHGAHELALRVEVDPVFGLVARLGSGLGLLPLNSALALDMLNRAALPGVDLPSLADILARVSQLMVDHPGIAALEIDPLLADGKGAMALEARVRVLPTRQIAGERLAIRPYPRELEQPAELHGRAWVLRPIRSDDAAAYAAFIEKTEAPDIEFRFFRRLRRLPARDLARYTQIDYDREMAFVAATPAGPSAGEISGEVRAFTYPDGSTAEFAILVRSDVQRRGLGRALLGKMIDYCRSRGVAALIGQIRGDNAAMIALARACGLEVELPAGAGAAVAHIDLRPKAPEAVRLF